MKENDEKSKKPIKAKSEKLMQALKEKGKTAIIFGKGFFILRIIVSNVYAKPKTGLTFFLKGPSERFKCFGNVIIAQKDSSF